jgi:hypothetical protein
LARQSLQLDVEWLIHLEIAVYHTCFARSFSATRPSVAR